jgi:hypothetical protein
MARQLLVSVTILAMVLLTGVVASAQDRSEALRRLKKEPSCPDVQKAALAYFNINKERVESLRRGAAYKGLMPIFELSGGFAQSRLDEDTTDNIWYPGNVWLEKGAGGYSWDARAKLAWNLPLLVFNAEELDVASLAGLVQSILKEVTRLYYMRRRLQMDLVLNPPADEGTRLTKELRLEELTALLDAMTGGFFERELRKRGLLQPDGNDGPEDNPLFGTSAGGTNN